MPIVFEKVPELLEELPSIHVTKDLPYKKENRLDRLSLLANSSKEHIEANQTLLDIPIKTIFLRMVQTTQDIISDLLNAPEYSIRRIVHIFTQGDRILYFGLVLISIAFLLFLIQLQI